MIGAETRVSKTEDLGEKVDAGTREAMVDAADRGYAVSQQHVPDGATSTLRNSGFEPRETSDGSIVWGYRAPYAEHVEHGTDPHWPPIEPLKLWAKRVLGNVRAAWGVQRKIAEEGTPAQPYVQPGIDAMRAFLKQRGISAYIEEHL